MPHADGGGAQVDHHRGAAHSREDLVGEYFGASGHLVGHVEPNAARLLAKTLYGSYSIAPEPTKVHKFMNFLYSGQLFLESIDKSLKAFKTYKTYQTFNSWLLGGGEHIYMTI